MNVFHHVAMHADTNPDKVACVFGDDQFTYEELTDRVNRLATGLLKIGVKKGSHVAVVCPNNLVYPQVLLALAKIGAVAVPLPLTYKKQALTKAVREARCDFAIAWPTAVKSLISHNILSPRNIVNLASAVDTEHQFEDLFGELDSDLDQEPVSPDTDFIFTLTSGSTGQPKPIVLTQETKIRRAFDATVRVYGLTPIDKMLVATPLYHSLAIRSLLMPLLLGATTIILPKFSPKAWLSAINDHQITFVFAVSNQLVSLLEMGKEGYELSSLRHVVSSSASFDVEIKQKVIDFFQCQVHECYGASELGVVTNIPFNDASQPQGSVGKALPGVEIKICDSDRQALPAGEIGEIASHSPFVFKEYYQMEDATKDCFDQDGFFYTGDMGYTDDFGYLYFVGRKKQIIKTGGISIFPKDIEACFKDVEGIQNCVAVGIEDEQFGEVVLLAYEADSPIDQMALIRHGSEHLTDYQLPKKYRYFERFPRSELGKILLSKVIQQLHENSAVEADKTE